MIFTRPHAPGVVIHLPRRSRSNRPIPVLAATKPLFSYRPYWAHRFGIAPVLPTSRAEMDELGWDSCDIVLVTGDAYIDHPSFGMALVGRLLESHGFRVGILDQPDWRSAEPFRALGRPNVMWGVTAGNMDSMVNRYTSDKKVRSDDAYSPNGAAGLRPDRSVIAYAQRCRQAYGDVPVVIGGIEASLRRIAHYDYWSDRVRRSVLVDSGADLLVYGNAERAIVEIAHRLAAGVDPAQLRDLRGTAFVVDRALPGYTEIDSTSVDAPGRIEPKIDPYAAEAKSPETSCSDDPGRSGIMSRTDDPRIGVRDDDPGKSLTRDARLPAANASRGTRDEPPPVLIPLTRKAPTRDRSTQVIRMPSFEQVAADPVLYAHASRILHLEANPGNARALMQRHKNRVVWINPPPIPLTTPEMDALYELPFSRLPHPKHRHTKIPAYEMIKFSVTILRGCFGGCSFCSITEHEGRIIQSRSQPSIVREIERIRDVTPGFTGNISDLGGPTANMYRMSCKSRDIESACRKPSCVFPDICDNLRTDHGPLVDVYKAARAVPGIKRVFIASGVRYDLAVRSPEWIRELAQHHTGGYLKIAPEHTEDGPLRYMMKPGIGAYDRFKALFDRYSKDAGKEQYLIPYFIAAHPGTTDEDMLNLALWLKRNGFRPDQVQAFLPSPLASATAMYHTGYSPLRSLIARERVPIVKGADRRRLHKAFLRYHDPANWPLLREALRRLGRSDLIGGGKHALVPSWQPSASLRQRNGGVRPGLALTQHTGLPPTPLHHKKRR